MGQDPRQGLAIPGCISSGLTGLEGSPVRRSEGSLDLP